MPRISPLMIYASKKFYIFSVSYYSSKKLQAFQRCQCQRNYEHVRKPDQSKSRRKNQNEIWPFLKKGRSNLQAFFRQLFFGEFLKTTTLKNKQNRNRKYLKKSFVFGSNTMNLMNGSDLDLYQILLLYLQKNTMYYFMCVNTSPKTNLNLENSEKNYLLEANHSQNCGLPLFFLNGSHL